MNTLCKLFFVLTILYTGVVNANESLTHLNELRYHSQSMYESGVGNKVNYLMAKALVLDMQYEDGITVNYCTLVLPIKLSIVEKTKKKYYSGTRNITEALAAITSLKKSEDICNK